MKIGGVWLMMPPVGDPEQSEMNMSTMTTSSEVTESILEANAGRKPGRVRLKLRLMAANPFAFFRGTDHLYGQSFASLGLLDPGPDILLCGDLHLENFGAFRTESGEFRYDVNDFDEAIVAPCSFDLIRCTTSILLAAEQWRLTPTQASGMVLAYLEAYRGSIAAWGRDGVIGEITPGAGHGPIWQLLGETAQGSQAEMLDRQTREGLGATGVDPHRAAPGSRQEAGEGDHRGHREAWRGARPGEGV